MVDESVDVLDVLLLEQYGCFGGGILVLPVGYECLWTVGQWLSLFTAVHFSMIETLTC